MNLRFLGFENSLDELEHLPDNFPGEEEMKEMERKHYETLKKKLEDSQVI